MKSFMAMLGFFTRIPVHINFEAGEDIFIKGIKHLFLIALIIGVPVGLVFMTGRWTGQYIAAFLSLMLYLFLSGGLHIDGLADTVDAFGSNADKQRMLEIMKDSRIGTFGVLSICVYVAGMVIFMAQADYVVIGLIAPFLFRLVLFIYIIYRYFRLSKIVFCPFMAYSAKKTLPEDNFC